MEGDAAHASLLQALVHSADQQGDLQDFGVGSDSEQSCASELS